MEVQMLVEYFVKYGVLFLFIIIFLEHLNFPGIPAAVVMPTIGAFVAETKGSLFFVIVISVVAAIFGSIVLYIIGYYLGKPILEWLCRKSPKANQYIKKIFSYSDKYGNKTIFICRLLPVVRTLISLVSGALRLDFTAFTIYSALGISIWNTTLISFGYFSARTILH